MARVALVFYEGAESEAEQAPYLIDFSIPDKYDYVRVLWPDKEHSMIPVEELISALRYLGVSRESINSPRIS